MLHFRHVSSFFTAESQAPVDPKHTKTVQLQPTLISDILFPLSLFLSYLLSYRSVHEARTARHIGLQKVSTQHKEEVLPTSREHPLQSPPTSHQHPDPHRATYCPPPHHRPQSRLDYLVHVFHRAIFQTFFSLVFSTLSDVYTHGHSYLSQAHLVTLVFWFPYDQLRSFVTIPFYCYLSIILHSHSFIQGVEQRRVYSIYYKVL